MARPKASPSRSPSTGTASQEPPQQEQKGEGTVGPTLDYFTESGTIKTTLIRYRRSLEDLSDNEFDDLFDFNKTRTALMLIAVFKIVGAHQKSARATKFE
jgi:hypothetical protein